SREATKTLLSIGGRIEACRRAGSKYFPGIVGRLHRNGTCDIFDDDRNKELNVPKMLVRRLQIFRNADEVLL
ncbi:MAG: hypothetical protein ACREOZ_05390, partial [Gloeomargaritales cyanobacterium]